MADVVNTQVPAGQAQHTDVLTGTIQFFTTNWPWMLVGVIIIILVAIIFVILNKLEEERRERDEPGYQLFKTVKRACDLNKDAKLIRTSVNWGLIWLWLIPIIGWILFFIIRKEHSAKIVDYQGNLLGYYRGDYQSQDNTWNFLVYKDKWLFIFEQTFVIKAPLGFNLKKPVRDKEGRIVMELDKKTQVSETIYINTRNKIQKLTNGDVKIECTGIEQIGMYYYCPVYIVQEKGEVVDLRKLMEGAIMDNTYQLMTTRLLNTAAKQMEKGMTFSPDLNYKKAMPQKNVEEQKLDEYE
jgi:hypothetical protein